MAVNTDDFLSRFLDEDESAATSSSTSSPQNEQQAISLKIAGRIQVSKSDFSIMEPVHGGQDQPFGVEYKFPSAVSVSGLRAFPIIVDANPDTLKMGDRCGIQNLRVNGEQHPTDAWEVRRWRPEHLLASEGAWLVGGDKVLHEAIRNMYRVNFNEASKMMLKMEVLGDGRGIRIISMGEDGTTDENIVIGMGATELNGMNHEFRSALKHASKHAFSLTILDPRVTEVHTLSYDLVTSSLGLTVGVEDGPNVLKKQYARFTTFLHSMKPSLLAPGCIQSLHRLMPMNLTLIGTVAYGVASRAMKFKESMVYSAARSSSYQDSSSSSEQETEVFAGSSVFSSKRTGARFMGVLSGANVCAVTSVPSEIYPNLKIEVSRAPTAVFVIEDPSKPPSGPALMFWEIEATNFDKSPESSIGMLPSNLQIRRTFYEKDHIVADFDTDVLHVSDKERKVKMVAFIDENSLVNTVVPSIRILPEAQKQGKQDMMIEVSGTSLVKVVILFSSKRFTNISVDSPGTHSYALNARDRDELFMGSRGADFDENTIARATTIFVLGDKDYALKVSATLSMRR